MQKITPCLWFNRNAQEAVEYYSQIFPEVKIGDIQYYPNEGLLDFQQEFAGKPLTIEFELFGQTYLALNAGNEFVFNESVSFIISCKNQEEIDYYWEALTKNGGQESMCGWCKDQFGMNWQVTPANMNKLMKKPHSWKNMLQMKKIVISEL